MTNNTKETDSFYSLFVPLTTKKAIIFITLIGLVVFFNMLGNGFVWDDLTYIIRNYYSYKINFFYAFGSNLYNGAGQYRPIPEFYFSVLCTLFGSTPFIYHFLQLVLHIACAILVYILFQKFFSKSLSFFLTVIFLVHPIQVESVTYIAQTISPLFFLPGILALLLSFRKDISMRLLATIFILLLLSLFAKETGILFIFMIIIYRYLIMKNNRIKLLIGSFITLVVYAYIRIVIGQVGLSTRQLVPIAGISLLDRMLNIPMIFFYYLKTLFFPKTLAIDQIWVMKSANFSQFYFPLLIDLIFVLFVIFAGFYIIRHNKKLFELYLFFTTWFLIGFLMIAQIFPLDMTVADRWFYFPFVGLLGMMGLIYQIFSAKVKIKKSMAVVFALTIISLLSIRTIVRDNNWRDVFTLYNHDIAESDNFDIENNLGVEYLDIGNYTDAQTHLKKSISMMPYELNLQNMAVTNMDMGDTKDAIRYYELALRAKDYHEYDPHKHDLLTYHDYATILVLSNNPKQADNFIEGALKDYPNTTDADLWKYLAITKVRLHDRQAAIPAIERAHQLNPDDQMIDFIESNILANHPFAMNIGSKVYKYNYK